jgi:hypothetical protein
VSLATEAGFIKSRAFRTEPSPADLHRIMPRGVAALEMLRVRLEAIPGLNGGSNLREKREAPTSGVGVPRR